MKIKQEFKKSKVNSICLDGLPFSEVSRNIELSKYGTEEHHHAETQRVSSYDFTRDERHAKHFTVNLPTSTNNLPQVYDGHCTVRQPKTFQKSDVNSYLHPFIFDVVREQMKLNTREVIKFQKPADMQVV